MKKATIDFMLKARYVLARALAMESESSDEDLTLLSVASIPVIESLAQHLEYLAEEDVEDPPVESQ